MNLTKLFVQYRMLIALLLAFLGPTVITVLMSFAGMTSPTQLDTMVQLIVWGVGVWAIGAAIYELYAGYQRYASTGEAAQE